MKYLATISFLLIISSSSIISQNSLSVDSLKPGSSYKFLLYDDTEIIGKLISSDSLFLNVAGEDGSYRLRKDNIFLVSKKLRMSKFKTMLSLGAGTGFSAFGSNYYPWQGKYSLHASGLIPTGKSTGVRIEAGFSEYERDFPEQFYISNTLQIFGFKGDFVFGQLTPDEDVMLFVSAGIGFGYMYEPGFETDFYNSYDSTYHHFVRSGEGHVTGMLSLGGTIVYRFSRQFGAYTDLQLNMPAYGGYFFFMGGTAFMPLRLGITYTIF